MKLSKVICTNEVNYNKINDLVNECITKAWFEENPFIEFCISDDIKGHSLCVIYHIIWYTDINDYLIKPLFIVIEYPRNEVITSDHLYILSYTEKLDADKKRVRFYIKYDYLEHFIKKIKLNCTKIFYSLYDSLYIIDEEMN